MAMVNRQDNNYGYNQDALDGDTTYEVPLANNGFLLYFKFVDIRNLKPVGYD